MSIGQSTVNSSNFLSKTSNLPSWTSATFSGWFQIKSIPSAFSTFFAILDATTYTWIGMDSDGSGNIKIWNSTAGFSTTIATVAVNDWVYIGLIHNGTSLTGYVAKNGGASAVQSITLPSSTTVSMRVLNDNAGDSLAAFTDYVRTWGAVLTQSELDTESQRAAAARSTNLLTDSPLPDTTHPDVWTINGALSNSSESPYAGSQIQKTAVTLQNGTTITPTLNNVKAGNLLILVCKWFQSVSTAIVAPTNYSTAESPTGVVLGVLGFIHTAIFYRENAPAGTNAPILTFAAGSYADVTLAEYPYKGTGLLDQHTHNQGTSATSGDTGTTAITTSSQQLIIAGAAVDDTTGFADNGLSSPAAVGYASNQLVKDTINFLGGEDSWKDVGAVGTQIGSWTWTPSGSFGASIATFILNGAVPGAVISSEEMQGNIHFLGDDSDEGRFNELDIKNWM